MKDEPEWDDAIDWRFTGRGSSDVEFRIDLSYFSEAAPVFAFVTPDGHQPELGPGLTFDGRRMIKGNCGAMDCHILKVLHPHSGGDVSFRFYAGGEYVVEIYYIKPFGVPTLIFVDDFICK